MKVFVTGCTGLLGNNLFRLLCEKGYEAVGLARSEEKAKRLLGDLSVSIVKGDMRNTAAFAQAIDGCEAVFHTAAYFREYYQPGDHAESLNEINVKGAIKLMAESDKRGVRRFIHVSSSGTIGTKRDGAPGDEETPPLPVQMTNLYFKSKGDAAIRAWKPQNGMEVIEILPGWMWGPGDAAPTGAGQLALDYLARKVPGILDGGTCVVDARDVAEAMIAALDRGKSGEKYIVAGRYSSLEDILKGLERVTGLSAPKMRLPHSFAMTFAWFAEQFGRLTGKEVLVSREAVKLMHAKVSVTSQKAEQELGAKFRPLDETLRDTVDWYKKNPVSKNAAV